MSLIYSCRGRHDENNNNNNNNNKMLLLLLPVPRICSC
jgi:hypothetical protein